MLPEAISDMFKNQTFNSEITTRQGENQKLLRPNPKLKKGDLIYDIFNSWNKSKLTLKNRGSYKSMRRNLTNHLNTYTNCTIKDCQSCTYTEGYAKMKMLH